MNIYTSYSVKIKNKKHLYACFNRTAEKYREAVDFLILVADAEWEHISPISSSGDRVMYVEQLVHSTDGNPEVKYNFDELFYKFPSYLRRAAIAEAVGKVSSYRSNLANWEAEDPKTRGRVPGFPKAGRIFPSLYRDNMIKSQDGYTAKIKVWINNTWDWVEIGLRKTDIDYIDRHCGGRKKLVPTLRKRGKEWFLDFAFKEKADLDTTIVYDRTIVAVDLGMNSACTCSVMRADGTILGRHFYKASKEYDSLWHVMGKIKKAQKHGAKRMPRLWARAKGINKHISEDTAAFIMDIAVLYNADVVVFERLNLGGKKKGSKKQRLHHWRAKYVQAIVTDKAHRMGMRISRVCAWGTSKYAFDGSGTVKRGKDAGFDTYSVCVFKTGKIYNCDLNASYNIGARYFIRELLKSVPETEQQGILAKVPKCLKRSTCTWIDLVNLNAALAS